MMFLMSHMVNYVSSSVANISSLAFHFTLSAKYILYMAHIIDKTHTILKAHTYQQQMQSQFHYTAYKKQLTPVLARR